LISYFNALPIYASLKRLFNKTNVLRELQMIHMMQHNR